jgi:hypothetical protein
MRSTNESGNHNSIGAIVVIVIVATSRAQETHVS